MTQPVPAATLSDRDRLREYVGERIPEGMTDADTFFTDALLDDLLNEAGGIVLLAAARGWIRKSSHLARLIDVDEQGSNRRLSQRYANALKQTQYFESAYEKYIAATTAAVRVAGRTANWATGGENYYDNVQGSYFTEAEFAVLETMGYYSTGPLT